uniref:Uncharacterized protein n=1 Tax=Rhizophora mucronata TaxID=61149 RepID=A0A2P2NJH9_RHIMU
MVCNGLKSWICSYKDANLNYKSSIKQNFPRDRAVFV